ncbi:MAG: hypothetical protein U1E62_15320 [Alsobacter sp.]
MRILSWAAWRCLAALLFAQSWSVAAEEPPVADDGFWSLFSAVPGWAWLVAGFAASLGVFVATALAALESGDSYPEE